MKTQAGQILKPVLYFTQSTTQCVVSAGFPVLSGHIARIFTFFKISG